MTGDALPERPGANDLVRPFVITGGRTHATDASLRMETMVHAVGTTRPRDGLERAQVVDCCREPRSIAEVAAELRIPLGVAIVLAGDLVVEGYLEVSRSDPVEIELSALTRMIERVRTL